MSAATAGYPTVPPAAASTAMATPSVPRPVAAATATATASSSGVTSVPSRAGATIGAAVPGAAGAASGALTNKIQKALTLRVDSQTSRDALKCLSGFFSENTLHTRRQLRTTIETQNLLLHQEFVGSFSNLERQIEGLEALVNSLDSACDRAAGELRRSRSETQTILEKATALKRESKAIDEKKEVLCKFLEKFRLSEADTQLMKSGDQPIGEDFFKAFANLEEVRANAREMLNTCGQQTSGVDILHETSEVLEASYERMFVWVQHQCKGNNAAVHSKAKSSSGELENSGSSVILKRTLKLLTERPVYFNHCVRDISKARRAALAQRFFQALSQGDSSSGARPIELQACDPVRYIGDMLAWIHENAASEREAIASLMGRASDDGSADAAPVHVDKEFAVVSFEDILDFTLEGLVSPFSNRSEQVLGTQSSIVIIYKVAQVFSYFAKKLDEVQQNKEGCLVALCRDMQVKTHRSFLEMWESQAAKLRQGVVGVYVSDLATPPYVVEAVNTLSEVLSIYESALVPTDEREADFLPILSAAFDPLLNHCQQVAAMMDLMDGQVFLINCVAAMQAPLRKRDFTAQRVAMYASLLDEQVSRLVEGQAAAVLGKLGLAERLKALREKPADAPLSSVPELHPVSLAATLRSFYNSLFTLGGALALPLLERITSRSLRTEARSGVARLIATAYEELYAGIKELDVATHTPEQVRTLLE
jgi:hypothetical protein